MRVNAPPPWALEALDRNLEAIERSLPDPDWMPANVLDELGCGGSGCAWSTADPDVAFKLTTSLRETVLRRCRWICAIVLMAS